MGKLVHLNNVSFNLLTMAPCETAPELAADFAGIWAAATRRPSR